MTLDELIEMLSKIRRVTSGRTRLEVYCDSTGDYVPLDDVELIRGDEFGSVPSSVRLT
jgi:hypothetical protein